MGSNGFIAFLAAVSVTTWLYSKYFKRRTMETKSSLILAAVSFVIVFMVVFIIAGLINNVPSEL